MRDFRHIILALVIAGAVSVFLPAGALASGCNGSAGDSQYVDPLQNCNPPSSSHSGGSGSSQTGGSTGASSDTTTSTTSASTVSASSTTTATASNTTSTTAKDPTSSKSLPYTGLDLVPALLVAAALLGGGLVLRRVTAERR